MASKKPVLSYPPVALLYLRVSTARQAAEGTSLEAQESKARAHAQRLDMPVVGVFKDEGISGKDGIEDRPGLKALIEQAKTTPGAVIVVYSISRLARRQKLLWSLLDDRDGLGLSVSSATEAFDTTTPTGRAMLGMIAVFAQLEADMVSERTKDALAEVKSNGKRLGQRPMSELLSKDTVKLIHDWRNKGLSQRDLVDALNRAHIPSPTGRGPWHLWTVQQALKLPLPTE